MSQTRREFLQAAAVLAGTLPATATIQEIEEKSQAAELQRGLAGSRGEIATLEVEFSYQTDRPDVLAGNNQFFYSRGRYHLRHIDSDRSLVRIEEPDRVLDAVLRGDQVEKATVRDRPGGRKPLLNNFLPMLDDKPALMNGSRRIDGERCLGLQQGGFRYWMSTSFPGVRGVDIFQTPETIRQRVTFHEFVALSPRLAFPQRVETEIFDSSGLLLSQSLLEVSNVALNTPLDHILFSIDSFLRI
jgi:hypothetical protein